MRVSRAPNLRSRAPPYEDRRQRFEPVPAREEGGGGTRLPLTNALDWHGVRFVPDGTNSRLHHRGCLADIHQLAQLAD